MGKIIGIDLGTTFSVVAVIDEIGNPSIVSNKDGERLTPSCIAVDGKKIEVGEFARKTWGVDSERAAARFKRDMGSLKKYHLGGDDFTPTDLSSFVLKKLKQDSEEQIGEIAEAVVTIPANFSHEAREATMAAAKSAGLNIKYIINEPTAAALYYAFKSEEALSGIYAVYDLGGGTFDVSIIKVSGQDIKILASNGVAKLGGDDFDRALHSIVEKKYNKQAGEKLNAEDYLLNDAEEDKKSLSKRKRIVAKVGRKAIEVTREEFEDAISSLIAQAEMLCEAALDEAGIEACDVKSVYFAGGSTRIPLVEASVERVFQQKPISPENVDEVVALGAALYGAYKSDGKNLSAIQKKSVQKIKVAESTGKCFGTLAVSYNQNLDREELSNSILISKGEKIPCSVKEIFYTIHDNQTQIGCSVTESTSPETDPRFVKTIWEGKLSVPPNRSKGQEVEITFGFTDNQIMTCKFKDIKSGQETSIDLSMTNAGNMNDDEIEKFLVE